MGTNTGLKRISNGTVDVSRDELRYIKRRYLHKDQLRQAIVEVINATLKTRAAPIWGEGTVACASDSKKFGAWILILLAKYYLTNESALLKDYVG